MTEVINDIWVPFGVRYGIPMELFYKLNPKLMMRYQPYMNEWAKEKVNSTSVSGWIAGAYVRDAIGANFSKSHRYPDSPISFYENAHDDDEEHKYTDADRFMAFATMFNKQFEEGRQKDSKAEETAVDDLSGDTEDADT